MTLPATIDQQYNSNAQNYTWHSSKNCSWKKVKLKRKNTPQTQQVSNQMKFESRVNLTYNISHNVISKKYEIRRSQ